MKYKEFVISTILLMSFSILTAQFYDTGTDPASIKWLQIKTGRFRVIYPESYGDEGIKFARSLEDSYKKLSVYFPGINFRLPVIIHNYTVSPNGYVAWAPSRMEIYPTPEQNAIPLDNIEQLTLHEMTHVMQMRSLYKGVSRFFSLPFGEQYYGGLAAYLPMWMLEGDAVLMETILSGSGRGRTPSFNKELKALTIEKGSIYSYDKMLLGSFKVYTPDEYKYGYSLAEWANANFGHNLFGNVLEYTAKSPLSVSPVNWSLLKDASLTKKRLYNEAFRQYEMKWREEDRNNEYFEFITLGKSRKGEYINYHSPVFAGEDSVVSFKTSMYNPPELVMIDIRRGIEKKLYIPGSVYPYFLSGAPGLVVWVETRPDPRWENRQFSIVRVLNLRDGSIKQLSHKTRYVAAGISPDGKFVAAVENSLSNSNNIVILDIFNGEILETINVPDGIYPQRPQWDDSGKKISFISLSSEGEGIIVLNLLTKEWLTIKRPSREDIQATYLLNDTIFYISSASGTDNIWYMTPEGHERRITGSRFGVYDLCISGDNVLFTGYTSEGSKINIVRMDELIGKTFDDIVVDFSDISDRTESNRQVPTDSDKVKYIPEPYRKVLNPLRIHSWMPFYADIEELKADPSAVRPGLTLLSQNLLSTVIATAGYEYYNREHLFHTTFTLKGCLPVFETSVDYGGQPDIIKFNSEVKNPSEIKHARRFSNSVALPLTLNRGNFTTYIWASFSLKYYNRYVYLSERNTYDYGQFELTGRFFVSNYSRSGMRDIYPRWAQVLDYMYTGFPYDKLIYGPMTTLRAAIYLPGIIRNHGLRLRYETDYQKSVKLLLYNRAQLPRGYENIVSENLELFSADYVLPLLYPDLNIPGLIYIKRLRSGIFYDYAKATDNTYIIPNNNRFVSGTEILKSFGTEVIADFHLFRVPFMISGGIQASWKDLQEPPLLKLIFSLDIYGMIIGGYKL